MPVISMMPFLPTICLLVDLNPLHRLSGNHVKLEDPSPIQPFRCPAHSQILMHMTLSYSFSLFLLHAQTFHAHRFLRPLGSQTTIFIRATAGQIIRLHVLIFIRRGGTLLAHGRRTEYAFLPRLMLVLPLLILGMLDL